MQEFDLQLKLLKYCGFVRPSLEEHEHFFKFLRILNYLIILYCLLTTIAYACKVTNILDMMEVLEPTIVAIFVGVKFLTFHLYDIQYYSIIDDIQKLNEKCKIKKYLLGK